MKFIFVLLFVLAATGALETYGIDYDNFNVERLVANIEELKNFIGCWMDTIPCTDIAASFKEDLPEAIEQACAKCTSAQKHIVNVFIGGFKKNIPEGYEKLKDKFDPERKYILNLEDAVAAY